MKKEETKGLLETVQNSIITADNIQDSLLNQFRNGKEPGSKTYIRDIDEIHVSSQVGSYNTSFKSKAWSWRPGEFNIWTGYNNEGKSQFLIYLCILKALREDKKFAFFSPENFPPDDFFDDVIHTIIGRTTDRNSKDFNMVEGDYLEALNRIKNNFFFVYPQTDKYPDFRISKIEEVFKFLVWEYDVYGCILDPYLKIRHEMEPGEPEHLYASRFMMDRINFTRNNNISYNMVMHQTTPRREKGDKNYPRPNLYNIKGGGTWADSTDNVLTIWRPYRGEDPLSTNVSFISDKIKKQKLVGIPFEVPLDFDRKSNRYLGEDGFDFMEGGIKQSYLEEQKQSEESQNNYFRNDALKNTDYVNEFNDPAPF